MRKEGKSDLPPDDSERSNVLAIAVRRSGVVMRLLSVVYMPAKTSIMVICTEELCMYVTRCSYPLDCP